MEKIRLQSETLYEIEVNDNGDTIAFDYENPEFAFNLEKMMYHIEKQSVLMNNSVQEAMKIEVDENELIGDRERAILTAMNNFYAEGRKSIDFAFGEGSSQAIFGSNNYSTMFFDLFEKLEPHFKQAGIRLRKHQEKVRKKYTPKDNKKRVI